MKNKSKMHTDPRANRTPYEAKKYPVVREKIPIKMYKEVQRSLPIICVDVVITDGKNFLLAKRTNEPEKNKWWIPGGRLLKNELLKEAAARVLKQETGLKGNIGDFLGFQELFLSPGYFPDVTAHTIGFVFSAEVPAKSRIFLDKQHSKAEWFSKINPSWHPYVRKFLAEAGFK